MDNLAKLKWQCRRGTKELDLILAHYLKNRYPVASPDEKARFAALLQLDDADLLKEFDISQNSFSL
jgi:antitoxin CptB